MNETAALINWTVAGLVYDIVGVFILARALMATRRLDLLAQALHFWDGNMGVFRALLLQRVDAWFGMPILLTGFALQIIGALNVLPHVSILILIYISLVVLVVIYLSVRARYGKNSDRLYDTWKKDWEVANQE